MFDCKRRPLFFLLCVCSDECLFLVGELLVPVETEVVLRVRGIRVFYSLVLGAFVKHSVKGFLL